jgi:putative methyltransferase (TIGR04325 family)
MGPKDLARLLTPPLVWNCVRALGNRDRRPEQITFSGNYASFKDALAAAGVTGDDCYQQQTILETTLDRTLDLERESKLPEHVISARAIRLLAAFEMALRVRKNGTLRVVDFGGAVGGHYFQLRRYLPARVRWQVVDLPLTAQAGRNAFGSQELRFYERLDNLPPGPIDIVLASSSLHYTPKPWESLRSLLALEPSWLLIDRQPLIVDGDRLTVQTVPPTIYRARYPAWFLSERRLREALTGWTQVLHWLLPEEQASLEETLVPYQGFLFRAPGR